MSYIPSLTLPAFVFASPAWSILLPVGLGLGSGLVSQPGKNRPKSIQDEPNPERRTFQSSSSSSSSSSSNPHRNEVQERYLSLRQPPLRPPPWIFAPVWTSLYALMGYAAHRAWTVGMAVGSTPRVVEDTRRAATLYTVQLVLNQLFMPLFFGLGRPVEALINVATLTGAVGYLTYVWNQVDKGAAACMVPYLAWLGFATYLTAGTGYLNGWSFDKTSREVEAAKKEE